MTGYNRAGTTRAVKALRNEGVSLDRNFTVSFSYCDGRLLMRWSPDVPHGKRLRKIYPAYLKARNEFLLQVARATGGAVVVGNIDGSVHVFGDDLS